MKAGIGFSLKVLVLCMFAGARAEALELDNIPSLYPTAISIQIDPARISERDLQLIKKAGFEYVRFGVRPPIAAISGRNPDYAGLLLRLRAVQLKPILTLFGGPDVWGEQSSAVASRQKASQSASSFSNFAVGFMGQHPDPDILWELWNEPEITTFLKPELLRPGLVPSVQQICSALQSQGSSHPYKVFGFGFSKMPHANSSSPYDELLDVSLKTCLSGISIHPYRQKPESLIGDFAEIHQVMNKYERSSAPVIASEWGYSSVAPTRDQGEQALLVLREYLSSVFVRLSLLNIYAWKDAGHDSSAIEDNYGLVDVDDQPKPALLAMQHLLSRIGQTQLLSAKANGNDYLLTLGSQAATKERRTVYIAWSGATQGGGIYRFARNGAKTCVISEFLPGQVDRACPASGETVELKAGPAPLALTLSF
ncbi:Extracellular Matrix protein PslG [Collimonas arenae]|uniref:Extracellular Matrix protein PslG n=1 Tax=Collimonas arenae TaxID=279058 RepID=A0A0A1FBB8_9BURK|nr:hypothetical protein [Collimonas arenae]AIY41796.1 Extracellular Matrix protein PslG [Collimonas arenae]